MGKFRYITTKVIKKLGQLLGFISLLYVGYVLIPELSSLNRDIVTASFVLKVFFITIGMTVSGLCLASAWYFLLRFSLNQPVSKVSAIGKYAVTQINKYLPGNVFHLLSRHVMSKNEKTTNMSLVLATALELMSVALAASSVAVFASRITPVGHPYTSYVETFLLLAGSFLLVGLFFVLKKLPGKLKSINLFMAFASHVAYVLIMSLGFHALLHVVAPEQNLPLSLSIFCCSLSWFIGFVVPGVPAGIGLRELIMLEVLRNFLGGSEIALVAILFRLVTVVADVLLYGFGIFCFLLRANDER